MLTSTEASPWAACPYCGHVGLHPMRAPNPEPPVVASPAEEREETISRTWDGRVAVHYVPRDKYDRDDERGLETVRECTKCLKAWGILPTRQREEQ